MRNPHTNFVCEIHILTAGHFPCNPAKLGTRTADVESTDTSTMNSVIVHVSSLGWSIGQRA